jgi:hypothetical protein
MFPRTRGRPAVALACPIISYTTVIYFKYPATQRDPLSLGPRTPGARDTRHQNRPDPARQPYYVRLEQIYEVPRSSAIDGPSNGSCWLPHLRVLLQPLMAANAMAAAGRTRGHPSCIQVHRFPPLVQAAHRSFL